MKRLASSVISVLAGLGAGLFVEMLGAGFSTQIGFVLGTTIAASTFILGLIR